ncbi:hypothetical protein [Streptomyces sp. SID3343]|uniref:hypothetical protein n=1 Tax=Streptomyces sp. SID3343 TaxID=2690260 RepID=UPI0013720AA2|nr:hypothetical protein [Streptomyces sp. SID3343]MYW01144.1 hypothetical protein [Streptomyces sp. SID3343]
MADLAMPEQDNSSGNARRSEPTPDGSTTARVRILAVETPDGRPATGDRADIRVAVDVPPSQGDALWLVVKVAGEGTPPGLRYYAQATIDATVGTHVVSLDLRTVPTGSHRDFLVVTADASAQKRLVENLRSDGNSAWDVNRTQLPYGATPIAIS